MDQFLKKKVKKIMIIDLIISNIIIIHYLHLRVFFYMIPENAFYFNLTMLEEVNSPTGFSFA